MIASQARMKSKLIEKGATLPSAPMRRKQVSGSTEVQDLPRLRDYAPGTDRVVFWQRDVRKAASGVSKGKRAQGTSDEHDRHMWALNEYAKRQGFDSFVERVQEGEHPEATSSTGMLKPTYDESGEMRVAPPELIVSCLLDMASGSSEAPKGGSLETLLTGKPDFVTTTTPRTRRNGSSRREVRAEARRCSRRVR